MVERAELAKLQKILDKEEERIKQALREENLRQAAEQRRQSVFSEAEKPVVVMSATDGHPAYDASSFVDEM